MLQISLFPQSCAGLRSKELAKKLFTRASGNIVNRISSLESKWEDKQKYLVSKVHKCRQQKPLQKKKNKRGHTGRSTQNLPFIREAIFKNYEL